MRCGQVLVPVPDTTAISRAAVQLDGRRSQISLEPAHGPLQLAQCDSFTVEFWIQPRAPVAIAAATSSTPEADDASRDDEMMQYLKDQENVKDPQAGRILEGAESTAGSVAPGVFPSAQDLEHRLLDDATNQPLVTFTTGRASTLCLLADRDGRLFFDKGLPNTSTSTTIAQDAWSHVAIIYTASSAKVQLVINGLVEYAVFDLPSKINTLLSFGVRSDHCWFTGAYSEIRLWSIALDPLYIKLSMEHVSPGLHEKLIGCWRCNEGQGNSLYDLTSSSSDLDIKRLRTESVDLHWTSSNLELSEMGGLSHAALRLSNVGYELDGGLSACVYYVQDNADSVITLESAGKSQDKTNKRLGRIVLCCIANKGTNLVLVDYAISKTGHIATLPGTVSLPVKKLRDNYLDTDENAPASVLDLDLVHLDRSGLTVHGMILELGTTISSGLEVTESAMGQVNIHFAVTDGQISCLQYDTCMSYEPVSLETVNPNGSKGNDLLLFPKSDSLKTLEVAITDGSSLSPDSVDLSIKATGSAIGEITETWTGLPRNVTSLLQCLQGSKPPQDLGIAHATPASDAQTSFNWTVDLNNALPLDLQRGHCIRMGSDWASRLLAPAKQGDTSLAVRLYKGVAVAAGEALQPFVAQAQAMFYDTESLVASPGRNDVNFDGGSHLLGFLSAASDSLIKASTTPTSFKLEGLQRRLICPIQSSSPDLRANFASCFIDKAHKSSGGHSMAVELWFRQNPLDVPWAHPTSQNVPVQTLLYYHDQGVVGLPALEHDVEQQCIIGLADEVFVKAPTSCLRFDHPSPIDAGELKSIEGEITIEFWIQLDPQELRPEGHRFISFTGSDTEVEHRPYLTISAHRSTAPEHFNMKLHHMGPMNTGHGIELQNIPMTHRDRNPNWDWSWHHYAFVVKNEADGWRDIDGRGENWREHGLRRSRTSAYVDGKLWEHNSNGFCLPGIGINVKDLILGEDRWPATITSLRLWETAHSEEQIRQLMGRVVPPERRTHLKLATELVPRPVFANPQSDGMTPTLTQYSSDKSIFAILNGRAFQLPELITASDDAWHHLAMSETKTRAVSLNGRSHHMRVDHDSTLDLRDLSIAISVQITSAPTDDYTILVTKADDHTCPFELRRLRDGRVQFYFTTSGESRMITFDLKLEDNIAYHLFLSRKASAKPASEQGWDHKLCLDVVASAVKVADEGDIPSRTQHQTKTESTKSNYDSNKAALLIGGGKRISGDLVERATAMHLAWIRLYHDAVDFSALTHSSKDNLTAEWTFANTENAKIPEANSDKTAYIEPGGEKFALSAHSDDTLLEVTFDGKAVADLKPLSKIPLETLTPVSGNAENPHRQITIGSGCRDPSQSTKQWLPLSADLVFVDEVRIWRHGRSRVEILGDMYCPYQDPQQEMAAYYTSSSLKSAGKTWLDSSGSNRQLTWSQEMDANEFRLPAGAGLLVARKVDDVNVSKLPPLALRPPMVQDILGKRRQPDRQMQVCKAVSTPTSCEYGAAVQGAELTGSWNVALAWIDKATGNWSLRTSFRVGRLTFDWMCDVSTGNTLVGYIEGAPPIAGENYPDL
jgi:hypothetical protein